MSNTTCQFECFLPAFCKKCIENDKEIFLRTLLDTPSRKGTVGTALEVTDLEDQSQKHKTLQNLIFCFHENPLIWLSFKDVTEKEQAKIDWTQGVRRLPLIRH